MVLLCERCALVMLVLLFTVWNFTSISNLTFVALAFLGLSCVPFDVL